jgi:hypothetical protein
MGIDEADERATAHGDDSCIGAARAAQVARCRPPTAWAKDNGLSIVPRYRLLKRLANLRAKHRNTRSTRRGLSGLADDDADHRITLGRGKAYSKAFLPN